MAGNYRSAGDTLELVAPSGGVTTGVGYVIGSAFVVALTSALEGETFRAMRVGKWMLPKAAAGSGKDFAQGEVVFWNNTAKNVDKTNAAYYPIGYVESGVASLDEECEVVLFGHATAVVGGG